MGSLRNYIVAILFILAGNLAISATFESTGGGGNWNDPTSWLEDGAVTTNTPGAGDTIIINVGDVITVTAQLNFSTSAAMYVEVAGTLNFDTGMKLRMSAGSGVKIVSGGQINPGGGGGGSNVIQIDGTTVWRTSDGTLDGPVDLGTTPVIPVPIKSIFLALSENSEGVLLKWISNVNEVDTYVIYRSDDLVEWIFLGEKDASQGENTFEDRDDFNGQAYYKVVAEHDSQTVLTSRIVSFSQNSVKDVKIFPNPATDFVILEGEDLENEIIKIHDNSGRELPLEALKNFNSWQINIQNFPEGAYFLTIGAGHHSKSIHFIKK